MSNKKVNIEDLNKENIHKVPEKYFDELPMKIQSRIAEEQTAPASISIGIQWTWRVAAVVLIFAGLVFMIKSPDSTDPQDLLADISSVDIIEYLENEDISEMEIAAAVDIDYLLQDLSEDYLDVLDDELSEEELELIYLDLDLDTEIM